MSPTRYPDYCACLNDLSAYYYKVVRRVMNAKSRFKAMGIGAVKRDKFANLLTAMTKETEENTRKKEIAEQAKILPANYK